MGACVRACVRVCWAGTAKSSPGAPTQIEKCAGSSKAVGSASASN